MLKTFIQEKLNKYYFLILFSFFLFLVVDGIILDIFPNFLFEKIFKYELFKNEMFFILLLFFVFNKKKCELFIDRDHYNFYIYDVLSDTILLFPFLFLNILFLFLKAVFGYGNLQIINCYFDSYIYMMIFLFFVRYLFLKGLSYSGIKKSFLCIYSVILVFFIGFFARFPVFNQLLNYKENLITVLFFVLSIILLFLIKQKNFFIKSISILVILLILNSVFYYKDHKDENNESNFLYPYYKIIEQKADIKIENNALYGKSYVEFKHSIKHPFFLLEKEFFIKSIIADGKIVNFQRKYKTVKVLSDEKINKLEINYGFVKNYKNKDWISNKDVNLNCFWLPIVNFSYDNIEFNIVDKRSFKGILIIDDKLYKNKAKFKGAFSFMKSYAIYNEIYSKDGFDFIVQSNYKANTIDSFAEDLIDYINKSLFLSYENEYSKYSFIYWDNYITALIKKEGVQKIPILFRLKLYLYKYELYEKILSKIFFEPDYYNLFNNANKYNYYIKRILSDKKEEIIKNKYRNLKISFYDSDSIKYFWKKFETENFKEKLEKLKKLQNVIDDEKIYKKEELINIFNERI